MYVPRQPGGIPNAVGKPTPCFEYLTLPIKYKYSVLHSILCNNSSERKIQ